MRWGNRWLSGVGVCVVLVGAAGCTSGGTGATPAPARESAGPTREPVALRDLDPCEVFEPGDRTALRIGDGVRDDAEAGGKPYCSWNTDTFLLTVEFYLDRPYDQSGIKDKAPVALENPDRKALRQISSSRRACGISVAAGRSAQVSVVVVAEGDVASECDRALRAANAMEPNLPTG